MKKNYFLLVAVFLVSIMNTAQSQIVEEPHLHHQYCGYYSTPSKCIVLEKQSIKSTQTNQILSNTRTEGPSYAPPTGYTSDSYDKMGWKFVGSNIDIQGKVNGNWTQVTFGNGGFRTWYRSNTSSSVSGLSLTGSGIETQAETGVFISLTPTIVNLGNYVKFTYTVRNTTTSAKTINLGTTCDAQFAGNDGTPIYKILGSDNSTVVGMSMSDGSNLFNLYFKEMANVTDADMYWFGNYSYQSSIFDNSPSTPIGDYAYQVGGSYDSGLGVCWKNRTIAAGATQTYSIILGVGPANKAPRISNLNFTPTSTSLGTSTSFNVTGTYTDADSDLGKLYYSLNGSDPVLIDNNSISSGASFSKSFDLILNQYSNSLSILAIDALSTFSNNANYTVLATCDISANSQFSINSISDQYYSGSAITPSVQCNYNNSPLTLGTHYSVSYSNNIDLGTATVTVNGIGEYVGSKQATFNIIKKPVSLLTITPTSSQIYTGLPITPLISIKDGSTTLVNGTDYTLSYSNNTNVGTATITITGIGIYSGTTSATFAITAINTSSLTLTPAPNQTFTGIALTPDPILKNGLTTLVKGTDYTLSYSNNTNVGTATITITGIGNYTGTRTTTFAITARSIADVTLIPPGDQIYSGNAFTLKPTVKYGDIVLVEGTDYSLSFFNNVNVGVCSIMVTCKGNYSSSRITIYNILPKPISSLDITPAPNQVYTGSNILSEPIVKFGSTTLVKGKDYSLAYSNNTNVGGAIITINGSGNFGGSTTSTFNITPLNASNLSLEPISDQTYSGSGLVPEPVVKNGTTILIKNTDYTLSYSNNINVGTATIAINGIGNFVGTKTIDFQIVGLSASSAFTIAPITDRVYNSNAHTPSLSITYNNTPLLEGSDYTLEYLNNINSGEGSALVRGINNFIGSKTVYFNIKPAPAYSVFVIQPINNVSYTGSATSPSAIVKFGSTTLVENVDYLLYYSNNTSVGTATIAAMGIGNFTGTKTTNYNIVQSNSQDAFTIGDIDNQTYTGMSIVPNVIVMHGNKVLVKNIDYTITFSDNINVGTANFSVNGIGSYFGTKLGTFNIIPARVSDVLTISQIENKNYTGSSITPDLEVKFGSVTLVKDIDYTVSFINNINVGTANVLVNGIGNFSGTKTTNFTIVSSSATLFNNLAVSSSSSSMTYTGSALTPSPIVSNNGVILTQGVDYTVSYSNNINVGTAIITINFINNFNGTMQTNFSILPINCSTQGLLTIIPTPTTLTYTASPLMPSVVVRNGYTILMEGVDYSVSYNNNINVGSAEIVITGMGNYTGVKKSNFTITPAQANLLMSATTSSQSYEYTGNQITPLPLVKQNSTTLVLGTDYTLSYSENINVGTGIITIYGTGNYIGSFSKNFSISPKPVASLTVAPVNSKVYTGSPLTSSLSIKNGSTTLVEGVDYSLTYSNNTNAGNAIITVIGIGNFAGTRAVDFTITPLYASVLIANSASSKVYTGSALISDPIVKHGNKTLVIDIDYTLSYSNNINVGTATITVNGIGNFTGTTTTTFSITPKDASESGYLEITQQYNSVVYTGQAFEPNVIVKRNNVNLVLGTDYTLSYSNNTNVGLATISITGKGNYSGVITKYFEILPANVSIFTINQSGYAFNYTSSPITPSIAVFNGSTLLTQGTDYVVSYENNINVDTAQIIVSGIGNYTGERRVSFIIIPIQVASQFSIAPIADIVFCAKAVTPELEVKYNNILLVKNTDYTTTYSNNYNVGQASILVSGIGNYAGTKTINFNIIQKGMDTTNFENGNNVEPLSIIASTEFTYSGDNIQPQPIITQNNLVLTKNVDYTLSYSDNFDAGYGMMTITGIGNYSGVYTMQFKINPKIIKFGIDPILPISYTGNNITPQAVALDQNIVVDTSNYDVIYMNNLNIGTAKILLVGKNNYLGSSRIENFDIIPRIIIFDADSVSSQYYTQVPLTPKPSIYDNSKLLVEGLDYRLEYANNINVGQADINIIGIGNYLGSSKTINFNIVKEKPIILASQIIVSASGEGDKLSQVGLKYYGGINGSITFVDSNYVLKVQDNNKEFEWLFIPEDSSLDTIYGKSKVPVISLVIASLDNDVVICNDSKTINIKYQITQGSIQYYNVRFDSISPFLDMNNIIPNQDNEIEIIVPTTNEGVYGKYTAIIEFYNSINRTMGQQVLTFELNGSGLVAKKFGDVLYCKNKQDNFVSYQWYRDGQALEGETKQFLSTHYKSGVYSAQITTNLGVKFNTCDYLFLVDIKEFKLYPNLTTTNQEYRIIAPNMDNSKKVSYMVDVYNSNGNIVDSAIITSSEIILRSPKISGVYLVTVYNEDSKRVLKLIVK